MLEFQLLGLLRCVRMLGASVHKQLFVHFTTQAVFGQHAFYSTLYYYFGPALDQVLRSFFLQTTGVAAEVLVLLVLKLVAGKYNLVAVDHDDVIASVHMGGIAGFVLATQYGGNARAHTTYGLIGTVYKWGAKVAAPRANGQNFDQQIWQHPSQVIDFQ